MSLITCDYDSTGDVCSGHSQPGTVNLRDAMQERWGHNSLGIYVCRDVNGGSGLSEHGEGRGYDDQCTVKEEGDEICAVLIAGACDLGIEQIIWWRRRWTKALGWQPYNGKDAHKTHIHIGQNWSGALYLSIDAARAVIKAPEPVPINPEDDDMRPRCMHWSGAIFAVGYEPGEFQVYDKDDKPLFNGDGSPVLATGPWRRTFPNMSRLEQVIGGGAVQVDAHNNAFEVTNNQFETVYQNRGVA